METTVTVSDVTTVGAETVAIEFAAPEGFEAHPGQFVKLMATVDGDDYARFYTLSSPDVRDDFEITVEINPAESGPFSEYLGALTPGDEIDMSGPFGADYYEGEPRVVVLAGGPGIGPSGRDRRTRSRRRRRGGRHLSGRDTSPREPAVDARRPRRDGHHY
jgi:Flavodoxin reductases (ferredoxin-NADPH reductases) family 1